MSDRLMMEVPLGLETTRLLELCFVWNCWNEVCLFSPIFCPSQMCIATDANLVGRWYKAWLQEVGRAMLCGKKARCNIGKLLGKLSFWFTYESPSLPRLDGSVHYHNKNEFFSYMQQSGETSPG